MHQLNEGKIMPMRGGGGSLPNGPPTLSKDKESS